MMTSRRRAPYARQAIIEVSRALGQSGTTSERIVENVLASYGDAVTKDSRDLIHLGLMVLAGRSGTLPLRSANQEDLFGIKGLQSQTAIKMRIGSKTQRVRFNTEDMTVALYDARIVASPKAKLPALRHDDQLSEVIEEMRSKGHTESVGVYLRDRGEQ